MPRVVFVPLEALLNSVKTHMPRERPKDMLGEARKGV